MGLIKTIFGQRKITPPPPVIRPDVVIMSGGTLFPTPSSLISKLLKWPDRSPITESNFLNFEINYDYSSTGDTHFDLNVDYLLTTGMNGTSYFDYGLKCKTTDQSIWQSSGTTIEVNLNGVIEFTKIYLLASGSVQIVECKNAVKIVNNVFSGYTSKCAIYDIRSCTQLGTSPSSQGVFVISIQQALKQPTIYANPFLATNNAGGWDQDLIYAQSKGMRIVFVQNDTPPDKIQNVSVGAVTNTSIQVNFTVPNSQNTIEYYQIYLNGVYYQDISGSGGIISGLTKNRGYWIEVVAVDIYYNKNERSDKILQSTTNI